MLTGPALSCSFNQNGIPRNIPIALLVLQLLRQTEIAVGALETMGARRLGCRELSPAASGLRGDLSRVPGVNMHRNAVQRDAWQGHGLFWRQPASNNYGSFPVWRMPGPESTAVGCAP